MLVSDALVAVGVVLFAYVAGSTPTGVLVCRLLFGVEVLEQGSGRSGATNVMRAVGLGPAGVVVAGDFLKGFVPALLARLVLAEYPLVALVAVFAAAGGHNWSVFLRFRGGRGVATSLGGVTAMAPILAAIAIPTGVATLIIGRYVSLSSLAGAVSALLGAAALYAAGLWVTGYDLLMVAGLTVFLFTQHIDNMRRFFAGTERRLPAWVALMGGRSGRNRG